MSSQQKLNQSDSTFGKCNDCGKLYRYHHCLQSGSLADCFGISKDPTSNYMFVMRYYKNKDLHSYLEEVHGILSWRDIVEMLWEIRSWVISICDDPNPSEISHQFDVAEEKKFLYSEQNQFHQQSHPQAFYTSRLMYFPELINMFNSNYSDD
ncbi:15487_t:CDS:2 [Funneliformis caledonium]|uniref:15487_t:CDS:1 n=1 Tax=Funneliformis caledonium TaxID=1117310 RepID=A0A9N9BQG4_9GLOM|nr:15487_t:CDS:2 [Funneliformis caledonium]